MIKVVSRHVRIDGCAADRIYDVVQTSSRAAAMMVVPVIAVMPARAGSGPAHLLIVSIVHCCVPLICAIDRRTQFTLLSFPRFERQRANILEQAARYQFGRRPAAAGRCRLETLSVLAQGKGKLIALMGGLAAAAAD
jgi:hypothetical protein